ncbi:MAG: hypothetical protein Q7O66_15505 [Dehalococcoidia bacterium]|nr:hypothetical protein [Dehalococcoidia bacterium]
MTRVDELQKKYPDVPREIIIKLDVLVHGVRDTDDLDKVSDWAPAHGTYQSYRHDMTLKELIEKRPDQLRPGLFRRPRDMYMKNGIGVQIQGDVKSDYAVREVREGRFALFQGEDKIEDIYFLDPKKNTEPEPTTSKGTPVSKLVNRWQSSPYCFIIAPVRYCQYFDTGEQCRFCNYNSTQEDARSIGLEHAITISLEETVEAYRIAAANTRFIEGRMEMGGFSKSERETKILLDFAEKIASAASYKPNLTCHGQAESREHMQRLKDAGIDCITVQMEVWGRELFEEICPGKAKHARYERWLEAMLEAVDIFGKGNVGGKIIAGVTLMPDNGHKTWQEARDNHIEGLRWLFKNGLYTTFTQLRLGAGSVYGDNRALSEKRLPPTEYCLDVATAHNEACMETGMYEKINKLMYCPMDCFTNMYGGDIGILALAGDIGAWVEDCVPSGQNWLANFVSSMKTAVKTP